jgi:hypothetical protein
MTAVTLSAGSCISAVHPAAFGNFSGKRKKWPDALSGIGPFQPRCFDGLAYLKLA